MNVFFFQAEDGIRDFHVTGVQTCALPILASLVIQSQVFFTILISVALHGERVRPLQLVAAVLAVGGYGLVAWRSITDSSAAVTLTGLGIVLTAGVAWACTNMVMRGAGRINKIGRAHV